MAHPYFSQLQEILNDVGLLDTDIVCKHFFSGAAAYANGKIVASLSPKGLAFKLSESRCEEVLSDGVAVPLRYFDKSPIKRSYVLFTRQNMLRKSEIEGFFRECIQVSSQDAA